MPPRLLFVLLAAAGCYAVAGPVAASDNWPQWRGPAGSGVANADSVAPLDCRGEHLAWRTPVVGEGHSSPIVTGGKVFLTSSLAESGERLLLAYDRDSGAEVWRRVVATAPREEMHPKNTSASSTPATDGELVLSAFAVDARFVVRADTTDGPTAWRRDLGPFESKHGFHSCPVLCDGSTLIAGLQDSDHSFVARLDTATGETLWKSSPRSAIRSFSPPHVVKVGVDRQVVVSGASRTVAFDWSTGELLWNVNGPAEKTVSSIVEADGRLLVCGGRAPPARGSSRGWIRRRRAIAPAASHPAHGRYRASGRAC